MKPQKKSTRSKPKAGAKAITRPSAKKNPAASRADSDTSPAKKESSAGKGKAPRPAAKQPASKKKPAAKEPLKVPTILLEGDASPRPKASGPGSRYALAPEAPQVHAAPTADLPESYGTGQLFLAARDPHWLYASWDLDKETQKRYNKMSREGHLVLKIFSGGEAGTATPDVHVHPESRNWFVHVPDPETRYHAVLGYYDRAGDWNELSRSRSTMTPPDSPSSDLDAEFATIPTHITFKDLQGAVKGFISENLSLVQAVLKSIPHSEGSREGARLESLKKWPLAKAAEMAKLVTMDNLRRVWMGSLEITELIRRRLQEDVSSMGLGAAQAPSSMASPLGGVPSRERKFWFNVNAELVIYGATQPDASVEIGGQPVKLRPDGSFSFRFSLPDGHYQLPVVAVSPDGEEAREACLQFSRSSDYRGAVTAHPQDSTLRPPRPENIKST